MYKKLKTTLIILFIIGLIIAITLILLSLARIDVGYIGLQFDNIVSNYSSNLVYSPGLYFIGIAREFVRLKQIPTNIKLDINTYTADYYKLNAKIVATYQFTNASNFDSISKFYTNFGDQSEIILKSIIQKKTVSLLSTYRRSQYISEQLNNSNIQSTLQASISTLLLQQLQTDLDLSILIESIVVQGVSSANQQAINRQINDLQNKLARVDLQKFSISKFIENYLDKTKTQISIAKGIFNQRADIIEKLIQKYGKNINVTQILLGNQIMGRNIAYASSNLKLRPQLYLLNQNKTLF